MTFSTRAYNTIELDNVQGTLTKKSNTERFKDEICYYRKIDRVRDLQPIFAHMITDDMIWPCRRDYNSATFEYYDYDDLGKQARNSNVLSFQTLPVKWSKYAERIGTILKQFKQCPAPQDFDIKNAAHEMYINKTNREYYVLHDSNEFFKQLCNYSTLIINGKEYQNYHIINTRLMKLVQERLVDTAIACLCHGDFCLGNILGSYNAERDMTVIKAIDPRGSFGVAGIYGDPRYDIAKLYHSFEGGYEYIVNDTFQVSHNDNKIDFSINDNGLLSRIREIFEQEIVRNTDTPMNDYRLIEGLIFIGMCARHYDDAERQVVQYATGIRILNDVLEAYGA